MIDEAQKATLAESTETDRRQPFMSRLLDVLVDKKRRRGNFYRHGNAIDV